MSRRVARTATGLCPISLDTVMEYLLESMIKIIKIQTCTLGKQTEAKSVHMQSFHHRNRSGSQGQGSARL